MVISGLISTGLVDLSVIIIVGGEGTSGDVVSSVNIVVSSVVSSVLLVLGGKVGIIVVKGAKVVVLVLGGNVGIIVVNDVTVELEVVSGSVEEFGSELPTFRYRFKTINKISIIALNLSRLLLKQRSAFTHFFKESDQTKDPGQFYEL